MSQRSQASVAGIKALSFAGQQLGVTAEEVQGSIEGLGRFLRTNPLAKSFIEGRLGVATTQNGKPRDTAVIMAEMGKAFSQMPLYMANAYAATLGISEREVMALRQGMGDYMIYYQGLLKRLGVDEQAAAGAAHDFMVEIRNVQGILGILMDKLLLLMGARMTAAIKSFRLEVEQNFDRIAGIIAGLATAVMSLADFITRFVLRGVELLAELYDGFMGLPSGIQAVIVAVLALAAAFYVFSGNWVVMAIYAIGAAILALYDDYKTFKEGGKHLIDWQRWIDDFHMVQAKMLEWWADLVAMWKNNTGYLRTYFEWFLLVPAAVINHWSQLGTFFKTMWGGITGEFNKAWTYLEPIMSKITGALNIIGNSWLGRKLGMGAAAVGNTVGGALSRAGSWIGNKFKTGADALTTLEDNEVNGAGAKIGNALGGSPAAPGSATTPAGPQSQSGTPGGSDLGGDAAFKFWKSKGFSDAGAAGMVAQEQHEGGFNPRAVGDGGAAQGLFQWHSGRREAIMAKTGIDISTATATQQREAMYLEMKDKIDGLAGKAFDAIRTATDPKAAAALGVNYVERPLDRVTNDRVRGATAADWYNKAQMAGGGEAGGPQIAQANTYHITGTNAETIATAVAGAQNDSNNKLLRNVKGAAV
jgi:hypothetical protein